MGGLIRRWFPRLAEWKYRFDRMRREMRADPDGVARTSFAQEGEDLLLDVLLAGEAKGSFVDVGAHHPVRFSNTYFFYLRGWRGLNIDAAPGSMAAFRALRPEDINVECAISARAEEATFFEMSEPAVNTFDRVHAEAMQAEHGYRIVREHRLRPRSLGEVLAEHWDPAREIHFMSIDVEGRELDVIASHDWVRYRPRWLLVENLETGLESRLRAPLRARLAAVGYDLTYVGPRTCVFARRTGPAPAPAGGAQ